MKTGILFVLGTLSAATAWNVANARGIAINDWGDTSNGDTQSILTAAASASTMNLTAIGISTPIALSFTPGVTSAPIYDDTASGSNAEEFAWGGNNNGSIDSTAQVVLAGTGTSTFQLSIGYSDSNTSDLYPASVSLGGITYSASLTSDPSTTDNYLNISYVGGAWTVTGESANGWKESGGPSSAPEIDAASAVSALTLLAGAITVLSGWAPRRRLAGAPR